MPPSQNKRILNIKPIATQPARQEGRLLAFLSVMGLVILVIGLLAAKSQSISDWLRLRGYQPSSAVSELADQDTMTPYARHLFYLNKPQLLSSVSSFRQSCPENENTIVIGCYHPGEKGIYLYEVKSADLRGVTQVTAAHEDLHAVYGRLSSQERQKVDALLENYYEHDLKDSRVKDEIQLYKKTEPNSVLDEMHSVFGTEIASLPSSLENYYKQYFTDRSVIIGFSEQYEQAFTSRENRIHQYDNQLAAMKQQIDSQESSLETQQEQLNNTNDQLKALLAAGQTSEYNAQIPSYNAQIKDYNSGVARLKSSIGQYNQLVKTRNAVASELTTLDKALDTRLAPATHN